MSKLILVSLVLILTCSNCISTSHQKFYLDDEVSNTKTIKVVHPSTSNVVFGMIEQSLTDAGWKLIAHHIIDSQVPNGQMVTINTIDTSFTRPQWDTQVLKLFDSKTSDYILRYQFQQGTAIRKMIFNQFNATLIDPKNGVIIGTFSHTQTLGIGSKSAHKVISQMASELFNRA